MSSELLLAAVGLGLLGAAVMLAAVLCDIRGPKKQDGRDAESNWPKAA